MLFVELVRGAADHVGSEQHRGATSRPRPLLGVFDQAGPRTAAAKALRNNQPGDFSVQVGHQDLALLYVHPANHFSGWQRGHKDGVPRICFKSPESLGHFLGCGGIAQLAGKLGDARGVGNNRPAHHSLCRSRARIHDGS